MCIESNHKLDLDPEQNGQIGGASKYPKISDDEFYDKIYKIYENYRIPKTKMTADQYCRPRK